MGSVAVFSFDVFDTCLVRTFACPTDLFYVLAKRILTSNGRDDFGPEEIAEFAQVRMRTEKIVRQKADKEDISLREVYEFFPTLKWNNLSSQEMIQEEISLECESARPVLAVKHQIDYLRQQGRQIIFISDMYLPEQTIRHMLLIHGLAQPDDRIYLSGEVGLTKQSGHLFRYVLNQENIKPHQLVHHGDNPHSDVVVPTRLGIKTCYLHETQFNRYENKILKQYQDHLWLSSRMAGISRVARLTTDVEADFLRTVDIAASVVAPLLTSFVAWVLQQALNDGIERLYFIARDGQVLLKIAQKLAQYMPAPECRYLYGSRQAWFLPSISSCNRKSLDWLVISGHSKAPRHLLRKLDIEPDEIQDILDNHNLSHQSLDMQLNDQSLDQFWKVIEHPKVAALIFEKAGQARQIVMEYFRQEGLCSSSKWAIVDVGWTLKTQRALKHILAKEGYDQVQGYYLAVSKERKSMSDAGPYQAFLLQKENTESYELPSEYLFRNLDLIEQVFTVADHGTTIGYNRVEDKVVPNLGKYLSQPNQQRFVLNFHNAILCYVDEFAKTEILKHHLSELKQAALQLVKMFLSNPTSKEAETIAWMSIYDDQNESRSCQLARPLGIKDIVYIPARRIKLVGARDYADEYYWLEGSLALSKPWAKFTFIFLRYIKRFLRQLVVFRGPYWWYRVVSKFSFGLIDRS